MRVPAVTSVTFLKGRKVNKNKHTMIDKQIRIEHVKRMVVFMGKCHTLCILEDCRREALNCLINLHVDGLIGPKENETWRTEVQHVYVENLRRINNE